MGRQVPKGVNPRDRRLLLSFDNQRPLQADELGKLFTTLARDYRKMNRGRTLVVASLKMGTLFAELSDAFLLAAPGFHDVVELAKAAGSMAKFAKTLWELYSVVKDGSVRTPADSRFIGTASLEAAADISERSKCEVSFYHKTKDETVKFKITPLEARELRRKTKFLEQELREKTKLLELRKSEYQKRLAMDGGLPSIPHITSSLTAKLPALQALLGIADSDQRAVAETIATVLQSMGHEFSLGLFAAEFEHRGLHAVAASLRALAERSSDETEPPAHV
jgi:hypothetical protein